MVIGRGWPRRWWPMSEQCSMFAHSFIGTDSWSTHEQGRINLLAQCYRIGWPNEWSTHCPPISRCTIPGQTHTHNHQNYNFVCTPNYNEMKTRRRWWKVRTILAGQLRFKWLDSRFTTAGWVRLLVQDQFTWIDQLWIIWWRVCSCHWRCNKWTARWTNVEQVDRAGQIACMLPASL